MAYTISPELARLRGRYASLTRSRPADDPDLIDARRDLRAQVLAESVARLVAGAPKLTADQIARVTGLLQTAGGDAAA
jgi:hypothetical protein